MPVGICQLLSFILRAKQQQLQDVEVPLGWWERLSGPPGNTHLPLSSAKAPLALGTAHFGEM